MNQNPNTKIDYGLGLNTNTLGDFAYELFIVGLENKNVFSQQFGMDFTNIRIPNNNGGRQSKQHDRLLIRRPKRKKRSKKGNSYD